MRSDKTLVKTRKSRGADRPVAGRPEILAAARSIGIRMGWTAVTIRSVARELGYTSPLLYEHFRDKQELLTELAIEGQIAFSQELTRNLPEEPSDAILTMVERYWAFMLQNQQLYRLMNGMDGVPIDRDKVTDAGQRSFEAALHIARAWLVTAPGDDSGAELVFDDVWALLHGMAILHLDRSMPFDARRAKECVAKILIGTVEQARRANKQMNSIGS